MIVMAMIVVMVVIVVAMRAAFVVGMVVVEEMRVVVERPLQVECAAVEDALKFDAGALGAVDPG